MSHYQQQENFIWKIELYGKEEDRKKIDLALEDPQVDPEVKKIILMVRRKINLHSGRSGSDTFPSAYE